MGIRKELMFWDKSTKGKQTMNQTKKKSQKHGFMGKETGETNGGNGRRPNGAISIQYYKKLLDYPYIRIFPKKDKICITRKSTQLQRNCYDKATFQRHGNVAP